MAIFRENGLESIDLLQPPSSECEISTQSPLIPLIGAKLEIPADRAAFERDWLTGLLERYSKAGAATLVTGRAGTGKTCLVAEFVSRKPDVGWFSVESVDSDWHAFARYFRAAWNGERERGSKEDDLVIDHDPASFIAALTEKDPPSILVLDNIHHLYDCGWFPEFFSLLIRSIPPRCHLILLSRSKPPAPVWRLRSKQVLNIIDEKLLSFSLAEARALFKAHGLPSEAAATAHRQTFGRAAELAAHVRKPSVLSA
jgi:LuxR family maltose regulon positive regulatory protein